MIWGFIFHAPESDPKKDRLVVERAGTTSIIVGVPDMEKAVDAAKALVALGAKAIELCGAFGLTGGQKVLEAVGHTASVSCVMFPSQSLIKAADAFAPFYGPSAKSATLRWAYIFRAYEAKPDKDRLVVDRAGCHATMIAVPDMEAGVKAAKEMVEAGAKAIELCGAFGATGMQLVIDAVGDRASVAGIMFPSQSLFTALNAFGMRSPIGGAPLRAAQ
jgi:heptaprenylglyceryl phosphate synthase